MAFAARIPRTPWLQVFGWGLLLWAAATGALALTEDSILLPSVVLLGSFLVPVTAIFWFVQRRGESELDAPRLLLAFFAAGVLGLLTAAVLETWLVPARLMPNLWVGLIEEGAKGVGIMLLARGLTRYSVRDGILLGTTVGLGFGAFEASGYTLSYAFDSGAFSLEEMVSEEVLRAGIAPFCHGVWSGLLGGAIFASKRRLTLGVGLTFLGVAGLHALWDASSNAAVVVTVLIAGTPAQRDELPGELPVPGAVSPQWLLGTVQWTVMILVALAGVALLHRRWQR
jgi:RsiW-degrading membrane proteinase PrsW (M82 family)